MTAERLTKLQDHLGIGDNVEDLDTALTELDTGNPATSVLLGYMMFDADTSSTNGNFTIGWDVAGIFTITTA